MTDPYKVLGVPTTATDDEVKRAYRKLAKQYHPDANPGDKNAEQRMKEINAAYDQIINGDPNAGQSSGYGGYQGYGNDSYGNGGYGNQGYGRDSYGGWSDYGADEGKNDNPRMDAARNYINFGRYSEAINVLNSIPQRDAKWYYYSATANAGLGNSIVALQHARQAAEMEPDNMRYRELLERLENPSSTYTTFGRGYSSPIFSLNKLCIGIILANLFCTYMRYCCR